MLFLILKMWKQTKELSDGNWFNKGGTSLQWMTMQLSDQRGSRNMLSFKNW